MENNFVLVGSGGHAKVVLDVIFSLSRNYNILVFDELSGQKEIMGCQIINDFSCAPKDSLFHIAVGDDLARGRLFKLAKDNSNIPFTVAHNKAVISSWAKIDEGSFLAANSIIGPYTYIREGCIVNHGAIVDHDCKIDRFTHIAPNATLGGNVSVGMYCLIGAGSTILPGVKIGNNSIIGAGAVVTKDLADGSTVKGNPAVPLNNKRSI